MPRPMSYDRVLFLTVGLLVLGGLMMVTSTSYYQARRWGLEDNHFVIRQCVWACVGLVAMLVMMNVPYHRLARGRVVGLAVGATMLALIVVLAMEPINGASRWIPLGPFRMQPSEILAKPAAILFTAWVLSRKEDRVNDFAAVPLPMAVVIAPVLFLIVIEPDLGSALMIAATVSAMVFVAGLRWRYVASLAATGALALAVGVLARPYRMARLEAFVNPDAAAPETLYQTRQSLVAFGNGGVLGVGMGGGRQKAFFLPEAHTDFVYASIGEEFGLVGTGLVLIAFVVLFWRGLRAASHAPDRFGFYLALGITTLLVLQGLINMGVCVGLLPSKGLALPFVSYGGSSLLATLAATGVLLNVSQHSN